MNGLVHSSVRDCPAFFQTSGPRGPSRFQIPDSRFWILDIDRDPVVARSDRPYVRPCTCPNTLHISSRTWAHPAACHSHLSYLGGCVLSVSSDVRRARMRPTLWTAFVVAEMNSFQLDMD